MHPATSVHKTEILYVMYDSGETVPFLAEMAHQLRQGKDFRFIAEGSSVNSLTVANCENNPDLFKQLMARRIDAKKVGIVETIDAIKWPREQKISKESKQNIKANIQAKVVLTGSASRFQKQVATHIQNARFEGARKLVFVDNFDYKKQVKSFKTVDYVQKHADIVMCPCKHTCSLFSTAEGKTRQFEIVGTPTLQTWIKQIEDAAPRKKEILTTLGFVEAKERPIVAFMDAYDSNPAEDSTYEKTISPLFKELAKGLEEKGYQVVIQPHPKICPQKVTTPELLSVCDFVIGYNSSTIFNSLALGKKAIYLIPELGSDKTFSHFSIDKGYAKAIVFKEASTVPAALFKLIEELKTEHPKDLFTLEQIPYDSIGKIDALIEQELKQYYFPKE